MLFERMVVFFLLPAGSEEPFLPRNDQIRLSR